MIRDAETKGLAALSAEMKDLAGRARNRRLAPHEYQGGSFAISNLGMYGIDNFDAVINPPHGSMMFAFLEYDDLMAVFGELRRDHGTPGAGAHDHDVATQTQIAAVGVHRGHHPTATSRRAPLSSSRRSHRECNCPRNAAKS